MISVARMSFRAQLRALMTADGVAVLLLAGTAMVAYDYRAAHRHLEGDTTSLARMVALNSEAALSFRDPGVAQRALDSLSAKPGVASAVVFDAEGLPFAQYLREGVDAAPGWPGWQPGARADPDSVTVWQPITRDAERLGVVAISATSEGLLDHLRGLAWPAALVLSVSALLAFGLASWLERLVSRPIVRLTDAARRVAHAGDYDVQVKPSGGGDLSVLAEAFNTMLLRIGAQQSDLRAARDELEERVEARVQDLRYEIRERKNAEQALRDSEDQLRQSQKMEAVGRLAGGVAHDFNNLLGVIIGYAELMGRQRDRGDADRARLDQILRAAERAAGLTRQLLALSRKQILEPRVIDLNVVVGELAEMLRRLIGEDVVLDVLAHEGLPFVRADPGQMEQVLMNLVVNARDAMPKGGRLTIRTNELRVPLPGSSPEGAAGTFVTLAVSDTGTGMSAEVLAHLFEPFFTTKEKGRGTGLGLATVYGIVQQSGGQISVDSAPGAGSTFTVTLPAVAEAPAVLAAEERAAPRRSRGETILLVEDETALRTLMLEILETAGYRVLPAASGPEALRVAGEFGATIDLLLTDVVMPGMSGRAVAAALAEVRPGMAVLFVSGYSDDVIAHHGVLDADTELVMKPFTSEGLAHRVRAALDARSGTLSLSGEPRPGAGGPAVPAQR